MAAMESMGYRDASRELLVAALFPFTWEPKTKHVLTAASWSTDQQILQ